MIVGHGMVAFALVAVAARGLGVPDERALALGIAAGAFAMTPDADMVYAPVGVARVDTWGAFAVTGAFWGASTEVHRVMTHSLVVAPVAAAAFAAWTVDRRRVAVRALSAATLIGLVAVALVESGVLGGIVMAAFAVTGVVVGVLGDWIADLRPGETLAVALVALLTHPFGDLFTGHPPELLYPFETGLLDSRVALAADPTLHLLAVFGIELATVWIAAAVYLWLAGDARSPAAYVRPVAAAGLGYAAVAPVLQPPTLEVSYHFVFSVLALGLAVGVLAARRREGRAISDRGLLVRAALTGSGTVTLAWAAYLLAYLVGLSRVAGLEATLP